jgi:predicted nucleic acid-binding protein
MRRVFADTFYWLAITNPSDQWREIAATAAFQLGDALIVTTDEVLTEFLAGMAGQGEYQRGLAVRMVRRILADEDVTILPQTRQSFLIGLDLYERRGDKGYSLTDCISMNACRAEVISEVLTNDHHFTQEGFAILITR